MRILSCMVKLNVCFTSNPLWIHVPSRWVHLQALGFQIPWITIFWFRAQRSWETIGNNNFFGSVKIQVPTFISYNVQKHVVKHTFKLKNVSVYYYLQKLQSLLKCQKKVKVSVKCVSMKVSVWLLFHPTKDVYPLVCYRSIAVLQAATILVSMASRKKFWRLKIAVKIANLATWVQLSCGKPF